GFAVEFEELGAPRLLEIELAEQPEAVEDRLRGARGYRVDRRLRREQDAQDRILVSALTGELNTRKKLRARIDHIGVGRRELRLGLADIRPLQQQVGRQAGRNALRVDAGETAAAHIHARGRLAEQYGQRRDVLAQLLVERWDRGALLREQRLLLC